MPIILPKSKKRMSDYIIISDPTHIFALSKSTGNEMCSDGVQKFMILLDEGNGKRYTCTLDDFIMACEANGK